MVNLAWRETTWNIYHLKSLKKTYAVDILRCCCVGLVRKIKTLWFMMISASQRFTEILFFFAFFLSDLFAYGIYDIKMNDIYFCFCNFSFMLILPIYPQIQRKLVFMKKNAYTIRRRPLWKTKIYILIVLDLAIRVF